MLYEQIDYIGEIITDVTRNSEDFKKLAAQAVEINDLLNGYISKFINYTIGYEVPEVSLEKICFPKRYFNIPSINLLPFQQEVIIRNIISWCFELGFATHFLFYISPNRGRTINYDELFTKFIPNSLKADLILKPYNKDGNGLPENIFTLYYENEVNPKLNKYFKFGFFKKSLIRNSIRNYFYCGILLGFMYDFEVR